jgi:hypothetical protein
MFFENNKQNQIKMKEKRRKEINGSVACSVTRWLPIEAIESEGRGFASVRP